MQANRILSEKEKQFSTVDFIQAPCQYMGIAKSGQYYKVKKYMSSELAQKLEVKRIEQREWSYLETLAKKSNVNA